MASESLFDILQTLAHAEDRSTSSSTTVNRLAAVACTDISDENRAFAARALGYGLKRDVLEPLLNCLADRDQGVRAEALSSIKQAVPWSGMAPWGVADNSDHCFDSPLAIVMKRYCSEPESVIRIMHQLKKLEGAVYELRHAFQEIDIELRGLFDRVLSDYKSCDTPSQITIIPSYRCNVRCKYCYVIEKIDQANDGIAYSQFVKLVDQAEAMGCSRIGFSGGEPTFHPDFGLFLDLLRERNFTSFFASNMIFKPRLIEHFDNSCLGSITAHLRPRSDYVKKTWNLFQNNLRKTRSAGIHVMLRYSVVPGRQVDLERILEVCDKTGINQVNLALTIPSTCGNNIHIEANSIRHSVREFVNCFRRLHRSGLKTGLSKPLPPCLLEPDDRRLLGNLPFAVGSCSIWQVNNTHNIVVNPDGSVWPCIVVEEDLGQFSDYATLDDIGRTVQKSLDSRAGKYLFDSCPDCELYHLKRCQGACLAYK